MLELSTRNDAGDEDPVNVVVEFVGNGAIGLHCTMPPPPRRRPHRRRCPNFSEQPFQSGVDVFMPANYAADGSITVTNLPRGDAEDPQTLNVPNWPSSGHTISVLFTDSPAD